MSHRFQTGPGDRTGIVRTGIVRRREAVARHRRGDGGGFRRATLLITDPRHPERLLEQANTPWLRLLARLCAPSLDRRLASGLPAESGRLLAARAGRLVSPTFRSELAHNWDDLLERARRAPVARKPRVPLCPDRIVAAEGAVRSMLCALSAPRPASARGVAMAGLLLSDGTGPVHNRHSATDLPSALAQVTAQLDPEGSLIEPA